MKNITIKIWALTSIIILTLTLFACSQKNDTNKDNNFNGNQNETTDNENGNVTDNGSENDNSNTEVPENTYTYAIYEAQDFSDGVAFVRFCKLNEKGYSVTDYWAAIDTAGNVLFNLDEKGLDNVHTVEPYKSGVTIVDESINDTEYFKVYDKSGNIVASPELNGYDKILAYQENFEYFIVGKKEESFSGDRYLVGIINNKGEYTKPLSDSHKIAQLINESFLDLDSIYIDCVYDDMFYVYCKTTWGTIKDSICYDANTDEFAQFYEYYDYINTPSHKGVCKYDEFGNMTIIASEDEKVHEWFDDAILISSYDLNKGGYYDFRLIDYQGNVITSYVNHDLTRQDFESSAEPLCYYYNGYLLVQVTNSTGANYCCLFDKSGNLVFEPIRMEEYNHFYGLNETGFIYKTKDSENGDDLFYWYNYDGTCVIIPDVYYVKSFGIQNDGLCCVSLKNGQSAYVNQNGEIILTGSKITE